VQSRIPTRCDRNGVALVVVVKSVIQRIGDGLSIRQILWRAARQKAKQRQSRFVNGGDIPIDLVRRKRGLSLWYYPEGLRAQGQA